MAKIKISDSEQKEMRWTLLDSEYIWNKPWLTARKDHVRLPSGVEMNEYYVLEYPEWVNIIAITEDGQFLMEKQYRHARAITAFEIPAGCVEEGETYLQAAQRELIEETGYGGGEWSAFMNICPNTSACTNQSHTFVAKGVKKLYEQQLERTEDIKVVLMSPEEVKQLLLNDEIQQALMAVPLWKYFVLNKLI